MKPPTTCRHRDPRHFVEPSSASLYTAAREICLPVQVASAKEYQAMIDTLVHSCGKQLAYIIPRKHRESAAYLHSLPGGKQKDNFLIKKINRFASLHLAIDPPRSRGIIDVVESKYLL